MSPLAERGGREPRTRIRLRSAWPTLLLVHRQRVEHIGEERREGAVHAGRGLHEHSEVVPVAAGEDDVFLVEEHTTLLHEELPVERLVAAEVEQAVVELAIAARASQRCNDRRCGRLWVGRVDAWTDVDPDEDVRVAGADDRGVEAAAPRLLCRLDRPRVRIGDVEVDAVVARP